MFTSRASSTSCPKLTSSRSASRLVPKRFSRSVRSSLSCQGSPRRQSVCSCAARFWTSGSSCCECADTPAKGQKKSVQDDGNG